MSVEKPSGTSVEVDSLDAAAPASARIVVVVRRADLGLIFVGL